MGWQQLFAHLHLRPRTSARLIVEHGPQARHNEVGMAGGLAAAAHQQLLRMQQAGLATGHLPSLQDLQAMQARKTPAQGAA